MASVSSVERFVLEHLLVCTCINSVVLVLPLDRKISTLIFLLNLRRKPVRRLLLMVVKLDAFMLLFSWLLILEVGGGVPSEATSDFTLMFVHAIIVLVHVF